MKQLIVCGLALCAAGEASAQEDARARCVTLSFAPLDENVPACTALLQEADALDPTTLAAIYAARAEAYEFALTYNSGHDVDPEELLELALADLDRAVAADPRHYGRRGDILFRLGRFNEAAESYASALNARGAHMLLESRAMALAAAGDHRAAIDDMTAAIGLVAGGSDRARLLARRAEMHEAAGDVAGAVADYHEAIRLDPASRAARDALARLGPQP
jgi:tetratricopeptide (TPR) repeat protein